MTALTTSKLTKALLCLGAGAVLAACDKPAPPPAQTGSPASQAPAAPVAQTAPQPAPPPPSPAQAVPTQPTPAAGAPAPAAAGPAKPANVHAAPAAVDLAPAPKAKPLAAPVKADGKQQVNFVGAVASIPVDWRSTQPANSMRVAQFVTPAAKNGESAELVVFFFAAGRGGTEEENIARWRSQFSLPNGAQVETKMGRQKVGEMPVTRVEFAGNYSRGVGMGSEAPVKPDQILLAAIARTPTQGNLTLHFYGNKDAVNQYRGAFEDLVASLRPSGH